MATLTRVMEAPAAPSAPCDRPLGRQRPPAHRQCASLARRGQGKNLGILGIVLLAMLSSLAVEAQTTQEISVTTPSSSVEAGEDFAVQWSYSASGGTTGDLNSFDIELRYCGDEGSSCSSGSGACGEEYASLCALEGGGVCMDSDGSYDVQVPSDTPAGQYSIMVALSEDSTVASCSDAFEVTEPSDGVVVVGEATLVVVHPGNLDTGSPFTARWVYDDGSGNAEGTFEVNLQLCDGGESSSTGDCSSDGCGTFSAALCEDPGCYDPGTGDYDVTVPDDQPSGYYKLAVINSNDQATSCSDTLFVFGEDGVTLPPSPATPAPTLAPTPTSAPATESPAAAPTPQPVAPPVAPPVVPPTPVYVSSSSEGTPGSPGTPPTPVPAKAVCDPSAELEFVYTKEDTKLPLVTVAHASGDRSEAGCLTLTKLYDWLATEPTDVPEGLLYTVDPSSGVEDTDITAAPTGTWLLSTSVEVTNGVTFEIKGTGVDGDCDELKLSSTVKKWYRIMGYGGNIDIEGTLIRSWDESKMLEHIFKESTDGKAARSYIACVSEVADPDETCDGVAQNDMGECRMDIIDSELGYLGYDSTEAYGVTWKVRGLCEDLSNVDSLFESVRVYGDMQDSDIHHMWYGMYSYGHLGGVWTNNFMHDNHVYGFDPHDDSDYLTIAGNTVYNNGNHGIIASKRCDHLLVRDNVVYDSIKGSGIMLHKSCDDSIVTGNTAFNNHDAGISLVETSRCEVTGNIFETNRWGFRVTLGSTDNVFDGNILTENTNSDIYVYYGSDTEVPEVDPFTGINVNNVFSNNLVTHVSDTVVDIEDSDGVEISSNTFSGEEGAYFVFLRATENHIVDNTGDAASGDNDDITDSCFTTQSERLPLCT